MATWSSGAQLRVSCSQSALKTAERASQKSEVLSTGDSTLIEASAIPLLSSPLLSSPLLFFRSTSLPARSASCASAHPSQHLNTPRNAHWAIAKEQCYGMPPLSRPHRRLTRRGSQRRLARLACKRRTTFSRRRSTGCGEYAEYSPESGRRLETGALCGGRMASQLVAACAPGTDASGLRGSGCVQARA